MSSPSREFFLGRLKQVSVWDVIIIGGGATGLGIAVDSANRGLKTLLLEQYDFAKGTSSRSTKLIHGGVRYLAQGNISLVYSALKERGILLRNAPHLVKKQSFIIPCYNLFQLAKYGAGLKMYDWLAGRLSLGASRALSKKQTILRLPDLKKEKITAAIEYFDAQFDDARLAIGLVQTCIDDGGTLLNYFSVTSLIKKEGKISGVIGVDQETQQSYSLYSRVVINAAGTFSGTISEMDEPGSPGTIRVSQGIHLVFPADLFRGTSALMIPKTRDGRLLFVVPWHNHLLVGTTDTPVSEIVIEPRALEEEVSFILETLSPFLYRVPTKKDILSVFAGLRPLVESVRSRSTKELSRDHRLSISASGLISITGGKWTTYRKMAAETVDAAIKHAGLISRPGITAILKIHGWTSKKNPVIPLEVYGSDSVSIEELMNNDPRLRELIAAGHPYTKAQVIWAVRNELARTVEDVLARRIRLLFLDAGSAMHAAPLVAEIMREELNKDGAWAREQVLLFNKVAERYLAV